MSKIKRYVQYANYLIINVSRGEQTTKGRNDRLPEEYKQIAMFIYKSKPRLHRFYHHSQLHIELETHSIV